MSLNTQNATAVINAACNAVVALANGGHLKIYDGTQPANANTAVTTQVMLADLTLPSPAFGSASAGQATANAITPVNAAASGTAAWFRVSNSSGSTLWDGTVGTSGANINLNSIVISVGASVGVTGYFYTVNAAAAGF